MERCFRGSPRGVSEERGGGSGTQRRVYQNWPDQIFPMGNVGFSHFGHLGLGGGVHGGAPSPPPLPPPAVYGHSNTCLGSPLQLFTGFSCPATPSPGSYFHDTQQGDVASRGQGSFSSSCPLNRWRVTEKGGHRRVAAGAWSMDPGGPSNGRCISPSSSSTTLKQRCIGREGAFAFSSPGR